MKTAICYFSYHHGNTLKVAEAMAEAGDVDLIDLRTRQTVHLGTAARGTRQFSEKGPDHGP